jgi:glutathione S-transferase
MYKLYWDVGKASLAPHALLEEIGAPYELVRIDTDKGEQHQPWYLKINPNARVPTLDHDGRIFSETAAIMLYLTDLHPDAKLAPLLGDPSRALYLQWMVYLTNTAQEALMCWFHANYYAPDASSQAAVKEMSLRRIDAILQKVNGVLSPYLLAHQFTAADLFLVMLCRWTRNLERPATEYQNLGTLVQFVIERPAWKRMMLAECITWTSNAI